MGDYNDGGGGGGGEEGGYNRPRRPNPETITYLRGLALDIQHAQHEIQMFLGGGGGDDSNYNNNDNVDGSNTEQEFPQSFAAAISAIDEIQMEIASLAGDEHGSQCIEVLARIAAPYSESAARVLLHACSGYHLHLATHRYGSHVVQSILQLAVSSSSYTSSSSSSSSNKQTQKNNKKKNNNNNNVIEDLALHEDSPEISTEDIPSLSELIQGIVEELSPHASQLAIHVCGSHVLRTLLCVLGGVDLVSTKVGGGIGGNNNNTDSIVMETGAILRGRKKNKKKKRKKADDTNDATTSSTPHAGTMKVIYRKNSRVSLEEFADSLESLTLALLGTPSSEPGELQQLSCHSSAGPLFIVLLRVLTYSAESARENFEKTGNHQDEMIMTDNTNVNAMIADFRLGISAPEPKFELNSLAHDVVRRLLCIQDDNNVDNKQEKHVGDIIYGLSGEPRGSHLLETILVLSPDSVHADIIKYGDFASPESMQAYVEHDVSNFVIQTLLTTIRSKEQAEVLLKVLEKVVISNGLVVDPTKKRRGILWRAIELSAKFRVSQESLLKAIRLGFASLNNNNNNSSSENHEEKKKQRKKASAVEMKDCILRLINLRVSEESSERISLDAAGVRCVYHLLRFTPRLCEEILKTIVESYSTEDLIRLAKDGLGSRCIMDGILEGAVKTPFFITAIKSLFSKLKGHWVSLSIDRVGHHTVKKMFQALPKIDDKSKLAEELSLTGGNRLTGNAMGRSIVELCFLDLYNESLKNWRQKMISVMSKEQKSAIVSDVERTTKSGEEEQELVDGNKSKTKRKRKRKKSEKSGGEDDAQEDQSLKKSKSSSLGVVDSIVNVISMPKHNQ